MVEGKEEVEISCSLLEKNEVTIDLGITSGSCIGNFVWEDLNFNGNQDTLEPGINDVLVELYDTSHALIATTKTITGPLGVDGYYIFRHVQPNQYYIKFKTGDSLVLTAANSGITDYMDSDVTEANGSGTTEIFELEIGDTLKNIDAGYGVKVSIGNRVWSDDNLDGIQDAGEAGINDVVVNLYMYNGRYIGSRETDNLMGVPGHYLFEDLDPGQYYLEFEGVCRTKCLPWPNKV